VISRRVLFAVPLVASACLRRKRAPFPGYAFIANQEGGAIAVVDLEVFAVAKHIPLEGAPQQVLAAKIRPRIYALTPASGAVHELDAGQLRLSRKIAVAARAAAMHLTPDERYIYVLAREPRALIALALDDFRIAWKLPLPDNPLGFAVSGDTAAVAFASGVRLIDLAGRHVSGPLPGGSGDFGPTAFLSDSKTLIVADRGARVLSLYDVATSRLIAHLPVLVRPAHLCFNRDGGQLFVTGEGLDAVVVIYPYRTPEVAETVLAGHAPGAMAASSQFLLVASPSSGDVSILNIPTRKVIAVVQVGSDPGFLAVTPDDQYALVLNRASGDVSVLRLATITPNRYKSAGLFTVIPVGSMPVSAAVRAI
jgi:YVTN family beta-propeller protein